MSAYEDYPLLKESTIYEKDERLKAKLKFIEEAKEIDNQRKYKVYLKQQYLKIGFKCFLCSNLAVQVNESNRFLCGSCS